MALQQNIETFSGLPMNAYLRVENVTFDDKNTMRFNLLAYASSDANLPAAQKTQFVCTHDLESGNVYKQAYEHLKTLPEFANAVDA